MENLGVTSCVNEPTPWCAAMVVIGSHPNICRYEAKLPFGITSVPEVFQCQSNHILCGLPGVLCHIDDILVFGTTREEHDSRFLAVLERIKAAGITLNSDKCQFS